MFCISSAKAIIHLHIVVLTMTPTYIQYTKTYTDQHPHQKRPTLTLPLVRDSRGLSQASTSSPRAVFLLSIPKAQAVMQEWLALLGSVNGYAAGWVSGYMCTCWWV